MSDVKVPDIGDFDEVEVIEILVSKGDVVSAEDPLLTLESDKATMEIPAPEDGTITEINIAIGDNVSEGTVIMQMEPGEKPVQVNESPATEKVAQTEVTTAVIEDTAEESVEKLAEQQQTETVSSSAPQHTPPPSLPPVLPGSDSSLAHASPGVRRFARELGADVNRISGTGPKARILKEDIIAWIKQQLTSPEKTATKDGSSGSGIPAIPAIDFSQFGETEVLKLSRIKKLSGPHLQRAWLNIPHVTHHDEADITELEEFRKSLKKEAENDGIRITLLSFVMKALVGALKKYPNVNASLAADGEALILKKYFNIGIAVDTPNGLVVPVIREVDRKSIFDLAREMAEISGRARDGKLKPDDLKGGCISISSLGGIGGTAFTPIVNAPEVAILGISRSKIQPVWNGDSFEPKLMLPLDLSYDHRVIDGAEAARFVAYLTQSFGDVRRLSL